MSPARNSDRRTFLKAAAGSLVAVPFSLSSIAVAPSWIQAARGEMPYRPLGKTGERVSLVGIGGAHIGYQHVEEKEATRIMHAAIDAGINFFDNSWDYNKGQSEERMGRALASPGKREKVFLMTKFCCHSQGWSASAALRMLDESLKRLRTDYLDLWQIHEVIQRDHPEKAFQADSAVEALVKAKESGKVRYVGFTGHRDPEIHLEMLKRDFPFDTVQMPLNVMDAHYRSFENQVLPVLRERHIGAIGMKPLGGGSRTGVILESKVVDARECLRYAMNLPVSTVITGIISMATRDQAIEVATSFAPFEKEELASLLERTRVLARDGKFENYKQWG